MRLRIKAKLLGIPLKKLRKMSREEVSKLLMEKAKNGGVRGLPKPFRK